MMTIPSTFDLNKEQSQLKELVNDLLKQAKKWGRLRQKWMQQLIRDSM